MPSGGVWKIWDLNLQKISTQPANCRVVATFAGISALQLGCVPNAAVFPYWRILVAIPRILRQQAERRRTARPGSEEDVRALHVQAHRLSDRSRPSRVKLLVSVRQGDGGERNLIVSFRGGFPSGSFSIFRVQTRPVQLTPGPERSVAGRLAFRACAAMVCDDSAGSPALSVSREIE